MSEHVFVGFGFGPIQSGLFVSEAFKSGNFKRIIIAEIDQKLVDAVRANHGRYWVNVASSDGISTERIDGIEIYNPAVDDDRDALIQVLSQATEIATSLPSVDFYDKGENNVVSLIARGLKNSTAAGTLIYTAENNNHAAEILEEKVKEIIGEPKDRVQFLNTVIGKMSQVVTNKHEIIDKNLKPITPAIDRAFLVEEFNKILVTKCTIPGFKPGIEVFIEKRDLLPFEEAKLYGHNAIHALMAYLGALKGYTMMSQLRDDAQIMQIAGDAFVQESGAALIKKYAHLNDGLFTEAGFKRYAKDLLKRMTNSYLSDSIDRAARDPQRKLGLNDRLFGTMQVCLRQGIEPSNLALGAAAGVGYLMNQRHLKSDNIQSVLIDLWSGCDDESANELLVLIKKAECQLKTLFTHK